MIVAVLNHRQTWAKISFTTIHLNKHTVLLIILQGPDPREIICTVINPSPNGEIVWMIGDEVQTNNNPVETNDYGDWQQSFNLVPTVGIDDKRFRCL